MSATQFLHFNTILCSFPPTLIQICWCAPDKDNVTMDNTLIEQYSVLISAAFKFHFVHCSVFFVPLCSLVHFFTLSCRSDRRAPERDNQNFSYICFTNLTAANVLGPLHLEKCEEVSMLTKGQTEPFQQFSMFCTKLFHRQFFFQFLFTNWLRIFLRCRQQWDAGHQTEGCYPIIREAGFLSRVIW